MEYPLAMYAILAACILLDIITGLSQACYNQTLDSKILRAGMWHKTSYIFIVVLALLLEYACGYFDLGIECKLFIPLSVYIIITEVISILENITKINPDLLHSPIFEALSAARNRRSDDERD